MDLVAEAEGLGCEGVWVADSQSVATLDELSGGRAILGMAEITLCARVGCSLGTDRERARAEMKPYAAAAAKTVADSIPADELPDEVAADLRELRERYDYYEHVSSEARHRELVTDRILDAVAIAGTPEEAVPRFREIIALGVDRIVIPVTASDGPTFLRTMAEELLPQVQASSAT